MGFGKTKTPQQLYVPEPARDPQLDIVKAAAEADKTAATQALLKKETSDLLRRYGPVGDTSSGINIDPASIQAAPAAGGDLTGLLSNPMSRLAVMGVASQNPALKKLLDQQMAGLRLGTPIRAA